VDNDKFPLVHVHWYNSNISHTHTYHTHILTQYTCSHEHHVHIQTADLVNADASEEEKVLAMIKQAGEGFDPSQYVKLYSFVLLHVTLMVP